MSYLIQYQAKFADTRRIADDAESAIVHIAQRLDGAGATLSQVRPLRLPVRGVPYPSVQVGIQFIQIGTNDGARAFLEKLDNDLKEKYNIRVRPSIRCFAPRFSDEFRRTWSTPSHSPAAR